MQRLTPQQAQAAGTEGAAPEGTEALDAAAGTEALVPEGTEAQ